MHKATYVYNPLTTPYCLYGVTYIRSYHIRAERAVDLASCSYICGSFSICVCIYDPFSIYVPHSYVGLHGWSMSKLMVRLYVGFGCVISKVCYVGTGLCVGWLAVSFGMLSYCSILGLNWLSKANRERENWREIKRGREGEWTGRPVVASRELRRPSKGTIFLSALCWVETRVTAFVLTTF